MVLNGFDKIAFIYDFLERLIFGKSIIESQKYFLNKIPDQSSVLILGGGSGWLLAELLKIKPNCEVFYIEASSKMIALSKKKIHDKQLVHFIHGSEEDIPASVQFDVVITNFYFDMFTDCSLVGVLNKIRSSLRIESLWIATDFVNGKKWWQEMMLTTMYWFFRTTCNIESQQLPEWNKIVGKTGVVKIGSKFFYKDFIEIALYQR